MDYRRTAAPANAGSFHFKRRREAVYGYMRQTADGTNTASPTLARKVGRERMYSGAGPSQSPPDTCPHRPISNRASPSSRLEEMMASPATALGRVPTQKWYLGRTKDQWRAFWSAYIGWMLDIM